MPKSKRNRSTSLRTTKGPIYLDYQATTPVDKRVFEAMRPYFCEIYGNPASRTHELGHEAKKAVDRARETIASDIGARSDSEIVFLSGATEANNLALRGVMREAMKDGKNHLITSPVEHKAVLDTAQSLKEEGCEVSFCAVDPDGTINPDSIMKLVTPKTALISIMHANNEIGTIYPIEEIGHIAEEAGVYFHVDAAQSLGKVPVDVRKMGIHLLSMSAHKIYGPKGIGALYVRRRSPRVKISPIITGGGHEGGMRSGTLSTPLVVGLSTALKLSLKEMERESQRLSKLREDLLMGLQQQCSDLMVNGSLENRIPGNLNVIFPGIDSEALMLSLRDRLAFSNGSACTSSDWKSSYVLKAMGIDDSSAKGAVRLGLGRFTTAEEIQCCITELGKALEQLKTLSTTTA